MRSVTDSDRERPFTDGSQTTLQQCVNKCLTLLLHAYTTHKTKPCPNCYQCHSK